ncbi:phospholipase/carboxylesterase [Microbacteriaceae bacterium MWH-Ta3]|nr:phospholipase/carboxylesterase [Microbacteriaceae bacterium MWH-Ta3]
MTYEMTDWITSDNFAAAAPDSPVLVLTHGYGSNERDLPGIAEWLGTGLPWVSLRAPLALPSGGFAWFPITTPLNPSANDVEPSTAALWHWIDAHISPHAPLIPLGFSQGGLMATQLLRTRPDRIGRTVVLAGFVTAAAQPADADLTRSRPPVLWARGEQDTVITPQAVGRASEFLHSHSTLTERTYPGLGHSVDERVLADVREFLKAPSAS